MASSIEQVGIHSNYSGTLLTLTPSSPNHAYHPVTMGIAGDVEFAQASGSGGWQIVERPKQEASLQWYDRAPFMLTIAGILDRTVTRSATTPDQDNLELRSWLSAPRVSSAIIQPPTITVKGPVLGTGYTWVLYSLKWATAIRAFPSGEVKQQTLSIVLYEYNPPFAATQSSPAETAQRKIQTPSSKKYTIKFGDTLAMIAAREMGKASTTNERAIIAANSHDPSLNMRSPNQVLTSLTGKTILIPSV